MKTVILSGGKGIRLANDSNFVPKAMIMLGQRPIIWHILKRYALTGYKDFVLALGSKGELIRDYFTRYEDYTNDIQISLGSNQIKKLSQHQEEGWKVSLVDTGVHALTGARIHRCKKYLDGEDEFMVTYSDCVADININDLIKFHRKFKRIATITGVIPPYREGELSVDNNLATGFYNPKKVEKNLFQRYVNGGFMVFNKKIFSYLSSFNECKLETEVFSKLISDKQLAVYPHYGFWKWLDTDRDFQYLNDLVDKNKMYWLQE